MANLTSNEILVLNAIYSSNYQDCCKGRDTVGNYVWSWSANPFDNRTSMGGVVASLRKKGLIKQQGNGEDATIALTEAGFNSIYPNDKD